MEKIGIFYGSSTGNAESVANKLQEAFGDAEIFDVADASADDLNNFSNLILGTSTWGIGELQDDFEAFTSQIEDADLNGKKVALYGVGDQEGYGDSFVDAMGEVYELVQGKGCEIVGATSTDGYEYDESKAEKDGKFVGLVIDEDNQDDLTDERVAAWVEQLKGAFN